jgi:hypothetical protein
MNELLNAAHGTPPPPPPPPPLVSLEQLMATQNELMRVLMENLMQHEACPPSASQGWRLPTLTSWRGTLRRLPRQLIRWRRITGFASLSPSLGFCTAPRSRRPYLWPSSFVDLRVLGGLTSPPPFRTATRCHGPNSARLFVGTTSLRA